MTPIIGIIDSTKTGRLYAGSAYDSIATTTLTSSQNTVTFSNIPSTYKHLQLRAIVRTDRAADDKDSGNMRFNSDSGSNYSQKVLSSNTSSVVSSNTINQTSIPTILFGSATSAAADVFGYSVVDIFDYANTSKNKTVYSLTGGLLAQLQTGTWRNTNAITSITLLPNVGTNFVANSRFALYGIKG